MTGGAARPGSPSRRRGRRAAYIVYYGLVGALAATATVEVTEQVFQAEAPKAPYASCREGLVALSGALDRARDAAPGMDGEDAAIQRFREALGPAWDNEEGVAELCKDSAKDRAALDAIERLRYAEEHAARREASELAPLRRRVQSIVERDLSGPAPPGAGSSAPRGSDP